MSFIASKTAKIINCNLKPFGAKIISQRIDSFDMNAAIQRIRGYGIQIDNIIDILEIKRIIHFFKAHIILRRKFIIYGGNMA